MHQIGAIGLQEDLAETSALPAILNGKYFKISSEHEDGNVKAICQICLNSKNKTTTISGSVKSTTNFKTHLKVSKIYFDNLIF